MTEEPDTGPTDPTEESPDSERPEANEYSLTDIFRGRMFCLAHGRQCYRRTGIIGSEWVCPDERHRRPIQSSWDSIGWKELGFQGSSRRFYL